MNAKHTDCINQINELGTIFTWSAIFIPLKPPETTTPVVVLAVPLEINLLLLVRKLWFIISSEASNHSEFIAGFDV